MDIKWNEEKNAWLKTQENTRFCSFDDVVEKISNWDIIDILENKNYLNQKIFIIDFNWYPIACPFVENEEENYIFLKTLYPARKYKKLLKKD